MNTDIIIATIDLADRAGALSSEWGHTDPKHWYMTAYYQGHRIIGESDTPSGAAFALAERLLDGATCRCLRPVTLQDGTPGCRWTLEGKRWEPGCDAEPLHIDKRGDLKALNRLLGRKKGTT